MEERAGILSLQAITNAAGLAPLIEYRLNPSRVTPYIVLYSFGTMHYHAMAVMPKNSVRFSSEAFLKDNVLKVEVSHSRLRANAPSAALVQSMREYLSSIQLRDYP